MPHALLVAITEQPDEELQKGLGHLQASEFLYETGLYISNTERDWAGFGFLGYVNSTMLAC